MKLNWKVTMGLAVINIYFNIGVLIYSYLSGNQILLAWSVGYSAFSSYYLNQQVKKVKEVLSHGRVVASGSRLNR
jgi:hypothetical protein